MCPAALRRWTTFVVLGIVASFAYAQSASRSQDSEAAYKLAGSVVNSVTGEPVRRAAVELRASAARLAFTDANGQFEFDNLPSGQAVLLVRKPGFFEEREAGQGAGLETARIGPDAAPVVLKLVPESIIYGRAQDAVGDPIEHLPIKVIAARIYQGRKHWIQRQMTTTNDDGEFRLANLLPGSYYLQAGPTWDFDNPHRIERRDQAYPAVFYPAASDPGGASLIDLKAGQQVNTNLILTPTPLFKISGQIIGGPANLGVNFEFFDAFGNSTSFPVTVAPGGRFESKAPAGSYTLEVNAWSGRGNQLVACLPLNTTADIAGLKLVLGPSTLIPIVVRSEATQPSPVSFGNRDTPVPSVHLSQAGVLIGGREFWDSRSRELSSPVLENVPPGSYSVEVTLNRGGSWYVQSVASGGVDLLRQNLSIESGVSPPPIEIVVRDDAASLSGRVTGLGNGRGMVVAVPDGAPLRASSAPVERGGGFSLTNLAPGSYRVLAFDRPDIEYSNPDVLDRFIGQASRVDLGANDGHTVNLELIHVPE
jgi:hypothetical protein